MLAEVIRPKSREEKNTKNNNDFSANKKYGSRGGRSDDTSQ